MSRFLSFGVLVAIILVIGFLFYRVIAAFLLPLFLALVLVVMFIPVHRRVLARCPGRPRLAAALTTFIVMLVVLIPVGFLLSVAVVEGSMLLGRLGDVRFKQKVTQFRSGLGLDMPYADELRFIDASLKSLVQDASAGASAQGNEQSLIHLRRAIEDLKASVAQREGVGTDLTLDALLDAIEQAQRAQPGTLVYKQALENAVREFRKQKLALLGGPTRAWLTELANPSDEELHAMTRRALASVPTWVSSVGGATTSIVAQSLITVFIMVVSIYFFLADGAQMLKAIMKLSPLDDRYEMELWMEFDRVSRAVVTATVLSAVAQGLLGGVGYWLAGVGSIVLLTMFTAAMALIPFIGAAAVWVPVSLWLFFSENRPIAAIALASYGAIVISSADNVIKPMLLQGQSNLHPLIALISVLGGVEALGPIGVLVGPMVAAFLQTVLKLLQRELQSLDTPQGTKLEKSV